MEITEVRVRLVSAQNEKLRAFCSITIDHDFVIRDLRIIEGPRGPFVAMPSRRLTQKCSRCGAKNPYGANYCNDCGRRLPHPRDLASRRAKLHSDIAHPINSKCREVIQKQVLEEYAAELERAQTPGYRPDAPDEFEDEYPVAVAPEEEALEAAETEGESGGDSGGEVEVPEETQLAAGDSAESGGGSASESCQRESRGRAQGGQGGTERRLGKSRRRRHFRRGGRGGGADGDRAESRRRRPGEGRGWKRPGAVPKISEPEEDYFARDRLREEPPAEKRRLPVEPEAEPEDNFGAGIFS